MRLFRYSTVVTVLVAGVFSRFVSAQTPVVQVLDHIHLAAPDQVKAVEWYQKMFGGQKMTEGTDRLMFGETRVIFMKSDKAQPSTGSAIDHIGFSFADLDAKMKEFESAGVKVVTPVRDVAGLFKLGFIEDPWGTRIEVVQDPETLGIHHVHLRTPDTAEALAWYLKKFGGVSAKLKGRIDGIKYGSVWLLAQRGDNVPSEGHSVDHIGWRTTNLDTKSAELKAEDVKFTAELRTLNLAAGTTIRFTFLTGPADTKIELVQR